MFLNKKCLSKFLATVHEFFKLGDGMIIIPWIAISLVVSMIRVANNSMDSYQYKSTLTFYGGIWMFICTFFSLFVLIGLLGLTIYFAYKAFHILKDWAEQD
jgi:uncharacterized membrane protein